MPDWPRRWAAFWHQPEPKENLAAARMLLAGTALWIVLSRPDLPSILELPEELWTSVSPARRARFLMFWGPTVERVLYAVLHLALVGALVGRPWPRLWCFLSGVLLYHFAPLETIVRTPNPYLRGLTVPTLGLLIFAFAGPNGRPHPKGGDRHAVTGWPLHLVQVLFCQMYLFAAYSKLFASGLSWLTAENLRGHLLILNQALGVPPAGSLGYALAAHPRLCLALGACGLLFEALFPLVLFWRRSRIVLVPLAGLFHLVNALAFRVAFPGAALLLLFVSWDALRTSRGGHARERAAA